MINTFIDKETFKKYFIDRTEKMYAINFNDTTDYQKYMALGKLISEYLSGIWKDTNAKTKMMRKTYYFSMEFLLGRMITNNIINLGLHELINESFNDLGLDLNKIEHMETDAGLGNGGLGRLAACFMDSTASLGLPVYGNCIRYRYGFFEQGILKGEQIEKPDRWLKDNHVWEIRRDEDAVLVPFYGDIDITFVNERIKVIHKNAIYVKAVPYDVPMVGANNKIVTTLRLWNSEPDNTYPTSIPSYMYHREIREISAILYPDDMTTEGKILRLKQQYLFSSAGIKSAIREFKKGHQDIYTLDNFLCFHINDTHPALIVAELMRILLDEENMHWDQAWRITTNICAYTNHTILSEALEKWPIDIFKNLLPRIYIIIEEINHRLISNIQNKGMQSCLKKMSIIDDGMVKMANLAIVGSFSVNGVAKLHTEILKNCEMQEFHKFYPNKFNNKTNGITHRRWCYHSNPELSNIINKTIGSEWIVNPEKLIGLKKYNQDQNIQNEIYEMKLARKKVLAAKIKDSLGISINPNSIFDIQVKRLHEYKRQLLNAMHIMYIYNRLKTDMEFRNNYHPHTFIFGAKAASSYLFAKKVIKLINRIADVVNDDLETNQYLKVVFVINYNVSYAEIIMPSADISEQISTAGKEASGTGNMKFMMNGAITLGTLDGANVEMFEFLGSENMMIFGSTTEELNNLNNYNPYSYYENDLRIHQIIDDLSGKFFDEDINDEFKIIRESLLYKDQYFILKDFDAYVLAHEKLNELYKDKAKWLEMSINNIAYSGYFSSDRTIKEYNRDIWKLDTIK